MRRSACTIRTFTLLFVLTTLFIGFTSQTVAEEEASTLSGQVVGVEGNPVAHLPIYISPVQMPGAVTKRIISLHGYFTARHSRTDFEGRFTITNIPSGAVHFGTLPPNINKLFYRQSGTEQADIELKIKKAVKENDIAELYASGYVALKRSDFKPDSKVLSLHVQGVTLYPRSDFEPIVFALKPSTHIKDIVLTVKPRMRVQGRVLFRDGSPVANVRLRVDAKIHRENPTDNTNRSFNPKTDVEGYFIVYLNEGNAPASYTFSVKYNGLVANAAPFQLNPGERLDGLTFTFDSAPIIPKEPIAPKPLSRSPAIKTEKSEPPPEPKPLQTTKPNEIWIVCPENGHAYKRVHCKDRDDAIAQATKENAYLVTIKDAKEQVWLERVFGHAFYWIGLSFLPSKNVSSHSVSIWQWDNGEPITYQNWLPFDYFFEAWDVNERIYAVTTFADGKWYAVSTKSVIARTTRMAIIEKADVKIEPPSE